LCRYIYANPVKAGLVDRVEEWPFSNYPEWIGIRKGKLVDRDFVRESFDRPEGYVEFVREYLEGLAEIPKEANAYLAE
jgi:hypothetical protein